MPRMTLQHWPLSITLAADPAHPLGDILTPEEGDEVGHMVCYAPTLTARATPALSSWRYFGIDPVPEPMPAYRWADATQPTPDVIGFPAFSPDVWGFESGAWVTVARNGSARLWM